jgi:hypothetical protein
MAVVKEKPLEEDILFRLGERLPKVTEPEAIRELTPLSLEEGKNNA